MGPTALLPLRTKACWGFFRPENPTALAGFEPANLGTKGQHATSRPPKPLMWSLLLQMLSPLIYLPLQIPKPQQPGQGGVVSAPVELLSIQILVEMLQCLHNCQQLLTGHTVVPLGLGQSFAEAGHNPYASILYLGQYSTNPHIAGVSVDKLLPWSWVAQDRCHTHCPFQWLEHCLCFWGPLECPFLFSQSRQRLSYVRESGSEPPVVTAPENSSAGVCQLVLASFSQLPAFWVPWLPLMSKWCGPGILSPSWTADTSWGSFSGMPLAASGTPSADCWVVLEMCGQWQWLNPGILGRHCKSGLSGWTPLIIECCWSIAKFEGHNCELPQPLRGRKCLLFTLQMQCHLPVSAFEVQCRVPLRSSQRVQGVVNPREQRPVLCDVMQSLLRWPMDPHCQHTGHLSLQRSDGWLALAGSLVNSCSLASGLATPVAASIFMALFKASFRVWSHPIKRFCFTSWSCTLSKAWEASELRWQEAWQGLSVPAVPRLWQTPAISHHSSAPWP